MLLKAEGAEEGAEEGVTVVVVVASAVPVADVLAHMGMAAAAAAAAAHVVTAALGVVALVAVQGRVQALIEASGGRLLKRINEQLDTKNSPLDNQCFTFTDPSHCSLLQLLYRHA